MPSSNITEKIDVDINSNHTPFWRSDIDGNRACGGRLYQPQEWPNYHKNSSILAVRLLNQADADPFSYITGMIDVDINPNHTPFWRLDIDGKQTVSGNPGSSKSIVYARAYLQEKKQTRRRQYVQCIINDNSSSSNDAVRVFIGIHRYLKEKDRTRRRPTTSNKQHRQHLLPTFLPSRFFASQQPILENGAPDCMHSLLLPPKLCLTITIYILFRCDLFAYLISFSSINFCSLIFTNTQTK